MIFIKTYNFDYKYNNKKHKYSIDINMDLFKEGADSLLFIDKAYECIAQIRMDDFSIILRPTPSCRLVNNSTFETYTNSIPEYIKQLLNINAEFNLNKNNIDIIERNYFEFVICKETNNILQESSLEFHKTLTYLDSSLDSFISELNSIAIYFIQEDFLSEITEEIFEEIICYANDDFDDFDDLPTSEMIYFQNII